MSPVTLLAPAALAAFAAAAAHAETPPQTRPQTLAQTLAQTRAETLAQTLPQTPSDFATYRPRLVAQRLSGPPPTIDGDLSDPAWREAATTEAFYQVVPEVGPPSEKTRAYIAYDDRHLYIALYMFDREPSAITRNLMERDPPLQDDDGVRVIIDPFGTNRDGFFFAMNPNGARNDALIENNNTFRDQWDTVWRGKARVVEDGWVAEMAIPFQSMSFDRNLENWGFQIVRTIRRKNEEIRWSNVDRARGRIDLTNPGALAGITGVKSGRGVEGQIFLAANATRDHELQDTATEVDPSANLFYRITPSLTGSVTVNTDFADQPLDAR
ncbi:MAG: carbohydrate binding family 9 domain-containing protein, partial [Pseudomonadota bacterium]